VRRDVREILTRYCNQSRSRRRRH